MKPPFTTELELLATGELGVVGELRDSSNTALVVDCALDADYCWAVYKPVAGEQPLFDFPPGLHRRERAAFLLSEHLGWHLVPPTVITDEAPFGEGSLQYYIDNDGSHYFPLYDTRPELHDQLRRLAVFDLLTNNTDRKSSHVLVDADDHIWGIDQGLCFHADNKLRTVIWEFAQQPIDGDWIAAVEPLIDAVPDHIAELLTPEEQAALSRRASRIVRLPYLPQLQFQRQIPWPPI